MKKTLLLILWSLATICNGQTLSEIARKINSGLPYKNDYVSISKVSFSNNQFILDADFNLGDLLDFIYFKSKPREAKEWFKMVSVTTYQAYPYLYNRMIEKKVDYVINVHDLSHHESMTMILSPHDIQDAIKKYAFMDKKELQLTSQCLSVNIQSPKQLDEITFLNGVKLTPSYIEYLYLIDDEFVDMNMLKETVANTKSDYLTQYLSTFNARLIFNDLIETGRSFRTTYKGKTTNNSFTISYTPNELKMAMNGGTHTELARDFTYNDFTKLQFCRTQDAMTKSMDKVGFSFYNSEMKTDEDSKHNIATYTWIKKSKNDYCILERHYNNDIQRFIGSYTLNFTNKKEGEKFLTDAVADDYIENNMSSFDNETQEELKDYSIYVNKHNNWIMCVKCVDKIYRFEIFNPADL